MAFQPLFRRKDKFIVVKRIRLTTKEFLEPGDEVSLKAFSSHRLLRWHSRRAIGKKGCPWVKELLEKLIPEEVELEADEELEEPESDEELEDTELEADEELHQVENNTEPSVEIAVKPWEQN